MSVELYPVENLSRHTLLQLQFASRLRSERERLCLSQFYVGEKTSQPQQYVHLMEQGRKIPCIDFVVKLGQIGFDLPYLLSGDHHPLLDLGPALQAINQYLAKVEAKCKQNLSPSKKFRIVLKLFNSKVWEHMRSPTHIRFG